MAQLYTSHRRLFTRMTSELNSHLAIHQQYLQTHGGAFHAIIHAQPVHVTYLTHIPAYHNLAYLNQHLLRWQPELIVNLPQGVALVPFSPPGSLELMQHTLLAMHTHDVAIWQQHGVIARSATSIKRACDLIEYVDTGARYEYMNLAAGERAVGLSPDDVQAVCRAFQIEQNIWT